MPFTIEVTLSDGSSTKVHRAFDDILHRHVLLKVLHRSLASDPVVRERFVREARACAALRSEHIVQIYDLTEIDGAPAIVMEFVEGRSLKDLLPDPSERGQEPAQRVALHVLRALTVAHAKGIVHRDIKPGNLLVLPGGGIKVTDFGLAQVAASTTLTADGMLIGTPAYLSPEAVRGEPTDARADLFSLGATIVETLSGERIFDGATYGQCLAKVSGFKTEMLDRFADLTTPEFLGFVKRLMDPNPQWRFSSAGEALADLTGAPTPTVTADLSRRPWMVRIASGLAVIAAVALGTIWAFRPVQGPVQPPPDHSGSGSMQDSGTIARTGVVSAPAVERSAQRRAQEPAVLPKPRNTSGSDIPDSGTVRITSSPWARVFVDDKPVGETPLTMPLTLPRGTHTIVFTHPSFSPIVKSVTVRGGREESVNGNFLEQSGYLRVTVTPWAEVFVDETYRDTTPLQAPIPVAAGPHKVRLHHSAFPDIIRDITVRANDTLVITHTFSK